MNSNSVFTDMINEKRLPHAMLLECTDKSVCEKTADYIAQALVCTSHEKPCGECVPCIKFKDGNHPDVYRLTPEGDSRIIKVDMIRALRDDAYLKPNEAKYKIYIISSADSMNENAQNALLKILEEPPENVFFILTCSSADTLLDTIISRVESYNLNDTETGALYSANLSEAVLGISRDIADSLCCDKELDLLTALGKLSGIKKDIPAVLDFLTLTVRNACLVQYGIDVPADDADMKAIQSLALQKKRSSLIKLIDKLYNAKEIFAQNVNLNLFITWLCAELRQA